MATRIALLGRPGILVDGTAAPAPRGAKCWAVLAVLVLAGRPVPRARLMELLFDGADDPAAALRWSLSELRRALGGAADVSGDPVRWQPAADTVVDLDVVLGGLWSEAVELPSFGGALLEGVSLRAGASFEVWLANERRRLADTTASILQEGAHSRLARGDTAGAIALAERLVAATPLEERAHELLVRALVAAGDEEAAMARVDACRRLFADELGHEPSPALFQALRPRPAAVGRSSRSDLLAAIDLGTGASWGGAYDHAIEALRRVITDDGDPELTAQALYSLGFALVHGVRGSDEEAVTVLHRAFAMATECGARPVAARAALELGLVETLRAHYPRMEAWFATARRLADGDARILAWIDVYAGIGRTDQGDYPHARATLEAAQSHARAGGDMRALAYASTMLGRVHLLRGEPDLARPELELAIATVREIGWTSFLPFPRALVAEVHLQEGDLDSGADAAEHSYALACQIGDPCWEGYALRGRGLLAAARGDDAGALELLTAAPRAPRRIPDTHDWVQGHGLDALCTFAVSRGLPDAAAFADELEEFAGRRGMVELLARAQLHKVALGSTDAAEAAALLVAQVDNPALHGLAESLGVVVAAPAASPHRCSTESS
ncbi:BTAD domain-containing putative transcriptional regulator [Agromyces mangrovi Wang et al. 2018]|uniref:BTAD domain-containing putative transcriptional regulator n=1 Tax=Agromyces mangrovi TaxID=1858653 RepID=UPI00257440D7|nr:BTAD domain-containing putative transcriptional regulator [Agromyces mangrovi]